MALNPTQKRINWINAGYSLMNGTSLPIGKGGVQSGLVLLNAWIGQGVANGFIPATPGGAAANIVVDSDFTGITTAVNAAAFLAGIASIQSLLNQWQSAFATIQAMLP